MAEHERKKAKAAKKAIVAQDRDTIFAIGDQEAPEEVETQPPVPAIKAAGASLIVVEQDIAQAMAVADRVYCMMEGRVTLSGTPDSLSRDAIHNAYFGAGH